MGMKLSQGARVVALLCVIAGVGVGGTSSWVLHKALQAVKNPTLKTANDLLHQVNTFFGGTTGLYDLDVIFRILISCSATALIGGFVQFIASFGLLLASRKGGQTMAKIWVIVHTFVILAIGGGFLCILTNELEINTSVLVFLIVSGLDFIFLILCSIVVFMYSRSSDEDYPRSSHASNGGRKGQSFVVGREDQGGNVKTYYPPQEQPKKMDSPPKISIPLREGWEARQKRLLKTRQTENGSKEADV